MSNTNTNPMEDSAENHDPERCNATTRDGSPCRKYPVGGAGEGRCRLHGGKSTGPDTDEHLEDNDHAAGNSGGSPPKRNGNAETHGLTADRETWFERHREEVEPLVRTLAESYVADAPFGFENTAKVDLVIEIAIDQVRLRYSNDALDDFVIEQPTGETEGGEPIQKLKEHPAHLPRSRIKRDNIRALKQLGILDDSSATSTDDELTVVEILSK
jgi:hypothetical protein